MIQPVKLSDPVYEEEQVIYGVKDKQAYIANATLNTKTVERRSPVCKVCSSGKAILIDCETIEGIGCNCCEDCRKNCYLK